MWIWRTYAPRFLIVVSAEHGLERQDMELIRKYAAKNIPMILAYNKTDLTTYDNMLAELSKLNSEENKLLFEAVVPTSCRNKKNIDTLLKCIKERMREGEIMFPQDEYTDKSMRYIAAETVREKILLFLQEEIPHGVQVVIERMTQQDDRIDIDALIIIEKSSHKGIIL